MDKCSRPANFLAKPMSNRRNARKNRHPQYHCVPDIDKEKTEGYDGGKRKRLQQVKTFTCFFGASLLPAGQPFLQVDLSLWLSFCFTTGYLRSDQHESK